jgi:predicted ArsR family transcriptional regulator
MTRHDFDDQVTGIAALAEPVRRALYRYVVSRPEAVGREDAAAAVGVPHHVAKFNLDKLEQEGLLDVEFSRPEGRRGPGAGRPAKHYKRAARDFEVSLPERRYDLAGHVMADAIAEAAGDAVPITDALRSAARRTGAELAQQARGKLRAKPSQAALIRAVADVLEEHGYEPRVSGKTMQLANCPFHSLAREHTDLVCGMNLDLIGGVLGGLVDDLAPGQLQASLTPTQGMCCVTIAAGSASARP